MCPDQALNQAPEVRHAPLHRGGLSINCQSSVSTCRFIVLFCRIRHCSSQSTSDSGNNDASDDAVDRTLPGSGIRARKAAAAKEKAEAQMQQERYVSLLSNSVSCTFVLMQCKPSIIYIAHLCQSFIGITELESWG